MYAISLSIYDLCSHACELMECDMNNTEADSAYLILMHDFAGGEPARLPSAMRLFPEPAAGTCLPQPEAAATSRGQQQPQAPLSLSMLQQQLALASPTPIPVAPTCHMALMHPCQWTLCQGLLGQDPRPGRDMPGQAAPPQLGVPGTVLRLS